MRSSCFAPSGSVSPSPTFARAPRGQSSEAQARAATASRRAGWGSADLSSSSCAATDCFCCCSSSRFCRALSLATGLALSRKAGVIFFSVLASWPVIQSSCLVSRCSSFSTSTVSSGTGMSISRPSETVVRTLPAGTAPRAAKASTSMRSSSARASHATAGRSRCRASRKAASWHQKVSGTRSFGATLCSARVLRICETRVHTLANQPSASRSRTSPAAAASGQALTMSEAGAPAPRGSRCQTASVTKGMKGCSSCSETSRA
mmetsp:Transcript_55745/g.178893  ORF Transcript_55745/g.178893 Transcript_55745/m.178893 type:complete len:262 (+) Transcript_55745:524-1309(+)